MSNNNIEEKVLFYISQDLPNMDNKNLISDIFLIFKKMHGRLKLKKKCNF